MRQVVPSGDFPANVQPIRFTPPDDMREQGVQDAVGLAHMDPETGETVALEFMFEVSESELRVLKHERYLTMTVMADHLHPFALQTSYPPDPKYNELDEHTHICKVNLTHPENTFWKCDNPRHDHIKDRVRECEACWYQRTQGDSDGGSVAGEDTVG